MLSDVDWMHRANNIVKYSSKMFLTKEQYEKKSKESNIYDSIFKLFKNNKEVNNNYEFIPKIIHFPCNAINNEYHILFKKQIKDWINFIKAEQDPKFGSDEDIYRLVAERIENSLSKTASKTSHICIYYNEFNNEIYGAGQYNIIDSKNAVINYILVCPSSYKRVNSDKFVVKPTGSNVGKDIIKVLFNTYNVDKIFIEVIATNLLPLVEKIGFQKQGD